MSHSPSLEQRPEPTTRREQILYAIEDLITEHERFLDTPEIQFLSGELEQAIKTAVNTVLYGENIPASCLNLVRSAQELETALTCYSRGDSEYSYDRHHQLAPKPLFWQRFKTFIDHSKEAQGTPIRIYPDTMGRVKNMLKRNDPVSSIAIRFSWMNERTGFREGPFMSERGRPDDDAIEKQARAEEKHLDNPDDPTIQWVIEPGWVHPGDEAFAMDNARLDQPIVGYNTPPTSIHAPNRNEPPRQALTVEDMIRSGANDQQIANHLKLSVQEVHAQAVELNLPLIEHPSGERRDPDYFRDMYNIPRTKDESRSDEVLNQPEIPQDAHSAETELPEENPVPQQPPEQVTPASSDESRDTVLQIMAENPDLDNQGIKEVLVTRYGPRFDHVTQSVISRWCNDERKKLKQMIDQAQARIDAEMESEGNQN